MALQGALFFGALFALGGLLRGEQMGKTLHPLFLAAALLAVAAWKVRRMEVDRGLE